MKEVAGVFAAQFVYIFLLGLQQLNVVGSNYALAMIVSFALGTLGFWLTAMIAEVKRDGIGSAVWWSFVLAGPVGIACAIAWHPWIKGVYERFV